MWSLLKTQIECAARKRTIKVKLMSASIAEFPVNTRCSVNYINKTSARPHRRRIDVLQLIQRRVSTEFQGC